MTRAFAVCCTER